MSLAVKRGKQASNLDEMRRRRYWCRLLASRHRHSSQPDAVVHAAKIELSIET